MSEAAASHASGAQDPAQIRDRLVSAATFDPGSLPGLSRIAQAWAEHATAGLQPLTGGRLKVVAAAVEAGGPPEPSPDRFLGALLTARRFPQPGLAELDPASLELLICAFFAAEPEPQDSVVRKPTDLDRSVLELTLKHVCKAGSSALAELADFDLTAERLTAPNAVAEVFGEVGERYVRFPFSLHLGDRQAQITVAIPEAVFATYRRALGREPAEPSRTVDRDEAWSSAIEESFAMSDLRLEAVLAKKKLSLAAIAGFEVGQTLSLDRTARSLISVECEDRVLFRARVGRSGEDYVMRIEERVDPAEEFIDDILSD